MDNQPYRPSLGGSNTVRTREHRHDGWIYTVDAITGDTLSRRRERPMRFAPTERERRQEMAHLKQMFPPSRISGDMLPPREIIVEIEAVEQRTGSRVDPKTGEQESWWVLYFQGWPLPIGLSRTRASAIADVLGSEDTDDWIGKKIVIKPFMDRNQEGKPFRNVGVELVQPRGPAEYDLPPETRAFLTGRKIGTDRQFAASNERTLTPSGEEGKAYYIKWLAAAGKRWDDFLKAVKFHPDYGLIAGCDLADVPKEVVFPLFKRYMEDLGISLGNVAIDESEPLAMGPGGPGYENPHYAGIPIEYTSNLGTAQRAPIQHEADHTGQPLIPEKDIPF